MIKQFTAFKVDNPGAYGYIARIINIGNENIDYYIYEGQISIKYQRHGFGRSIYKNNEFPS